MARVSPRPHCHQNCSAGQLLCCTTRGAALRGGCFRVVTFLGTMGTRRGSAVCAHAPNVPVQVLNQTSRIEMQLLENSLSTTKLEKQLLVQTNEIHQLQSRNK